MENFRDSRASYSEINSPIRPDIEPVQDFIPVLLQISWKFDQKWKGYRAYIFLVLEMCVCRGGGGERGEEGEEQIWSLAWNLVGIHTHFMHVLVTCKFDDDPMTKWRRYRVYKILHIITVWKDFSALKGK